MYSIETAVRAHFTEHRRPRPKTAERKGRRSASSDQNSNSETAISVTSSIQVADSHDVSKTSEHNYRYYYQKKVKSLLKAAHILHYCSIAILGVFVIQVSQSFRSVLLYMRLLCGPISVGAGLWNDAVPPSVRPSVHPYILFRLISPEGKVVLR